MATLKVVRHHTDEGFRVGLYDDSINRILYMGAIRASSVPANDPYIKVIRDATRRDVSKFRKAVRAFNGNTMRKIPKTVRHFIN